MNEKYVKSFSLDKSNVYNLVITFDVSTGKAKFYIRKNNAKNLLIYTKQPFELSDKYIVEQFKLNNKSTIYLMSITPQESTFSSFFVFDTSGRIFEAGDSDRFPYLQDLDADGDDELIIGLNTLGQRATEYTTDYVAYPMVYAWDKTNDNFYLNDVYAYPELLESYLIELSRYEQEVHDSKKKRRDFCLNSPEALGYKKMCEKLIP